MKTSTLSALALTLTATLGLSPALAPALAGTGCSAGSAESYGHHKEAKADIVDTAVSAGIFETLVAAVTAADLVDVLKGEGPFTVMAPTDEAFAALPEGTIETLLKPENKDKLVAILTYHVIPAKAKAKDALEMETAPTVQGDELTFAVVDGQAQVNGVNIIKTDIMASNGVVHVIDEMLMPPMDEKM